MTIERAELLAKLETVAPALADNAIVPAYTHIHFTGDHLLTTNERIAISAPCKTDYRGVLPGKILIDELSIGAHGKKVTIKETNGVAKITFGRTKLDLPVLPAENFRFVMPPRPRAGDGKIASDHPFFQGVEDCLQSISSYATVPDQLGITMLMDGRDIRMFATNRATITAAKVRIPDFVMPRVILATDFCQQMLKLNKDAPVEKTRQLVIRADHALFTVNGIVLFGRLVASDNPLDFVATLARHLPQGYPNGMAKMDERGEQRKRLQIALEMATGITNVVGKETKTRIIAQNDVLRFMAKSDRGVLDDTVNLDKHPNVEIAVNAKLVSDGYGRYENFLITKDCIIMSRDPSIYLVAAFED